MSYLPPVSIVEDNKTGVRPQPCDPCVSLCPEGIGKVEITQMSNAVMETPEKKVLDITVTCQGR